LRFFLYTLYIVLPGAKLRVQVLFGAATLPLAGRSSSDIFSFPGRTGIVELCINLISTNNDTVCNSYIFLQVKNCDLSCGLEHYEYLFAKVFDPKSVLDQCKTV
jgi:hypothetical protein